MISQGAFLFTLLLKRHDAHNDATEKWLANAHTLAWTSKGGCFAMPESMISDQLLPLLVTRAVFLPLAD